MIVVAFLFFIMLLLIILGMPIVYSIGISSIIVLLSQGIGSPTLMASRMFTGLDSFILSAIPFFLLSAELLTRGGLINRLVIFISTVIGHVRGGLAQVNILVSMLFAGVNASSTADAAAIGGILIPSMIKEGYDADISAVVTATSSCLGPIIPPSILMILYAFLTGTSISKMFLGGVIPGILMTVSLMGITDFWVVKRGYKKHREKVASLKEITTIGFKTTPALIVPVIIVWGLLFGVITPTETGILATLVALLLGILVYRELSFNKIKNSFKAAIHMSTVIFCIIAVATVFSEILVRNMFSQKILEFIYSITKNPKGVLALFAFSTFLLGMVIDTTPLLIMLAAPLHDAAMIVGIDPIHFGVILVMSSLIGTVSPPVCVNLCLDCGIAKIPLSKTFGVIWSYLLAMFAVVLICILIPETITWLPSITKY